jgi:hypothetical protein
MRVSWVALADTKFRVREPGGERQQSLLGCKIPSMVSTFPFNGKELCLFVLNKNFAGRRATAIHIWRENK